MVNVKRFILVCAIFGGMILLGCGGGSGSGNGGGSGNGDGDKPSQYRETYRFYYGSNIRSMIGRNSNLIAWYKKTEYPTANKVVVTNDNIGSDGIALTADDYITGRYTHEYSDDGLSAKGVYYDAGPDHVFGTADDPVQDIWTYKYKSSKSQEVMQIGYSTGPDGLPFTSDDIIQRVKRTDYDALGKVCLVVVYSDPGADNDWFTYDDNHVKSEGSSTWTYAKDKVDSGTYFPPYFLGNQYVKSTNTGDTELRVIWNAGPDNIPLNGDDYIISYDKYVTKNGVMSSSCFANGPGADGKWFTDDDDFTGRETNVTAEDSAYKPEALQTYQYEKYSAGTWIVSADHFRQEACLSTGQMTFFACGYNDASHVFNPYTDGYSGCEPLNYYVEYEKY